jgi:hypothetical protein
MRSAHQFSHTVHRCSHTLHHSSHTAAALHQQQQQQRHDSKVVKLQAAKPADHTHRKSSAPLNQDPSILRCWASTLAAMLRCTWYLLNARAIESLRSLNILLQHACSMYLETAPVAS